MSIDPPKTTTQTLAELVAKKTALRAGGQGRPGGGRQSERAAAAHSASKSKPTLGR